MGILPADAGWTLDRTFKSRLASPVIVYQRLHFTQAQLQIDLRQRVHRPEMLQNLCHLQPEFGVHRRTLLWLTMLGFLIESQTIHRNGRMVMARRPIDEAL
jgi:hypothetical protein